MIRFPLNSQSSRRHAAGSICCVAVIVWLVAPHGAQAQAPPAAGLTSTAAAQAPPSPADRSFSPLGGAQINASSDSSNATLKLTSGASRWVGSTTTDDHTAVTDLFTIALATPIAKGGGSTTLGTLDGLAASSSVQLQYSQYRLDGFRWAVPDLRRVTEICDKAKANYAAANRRVFNGPCSTGFIRTYDLEDFDAYRSLFFTGAPRVLTAVGFTGKMGYEAHNYYDPTTLIKASVNKTPLAVGTYFTVVSAGRQWAMTGEAQYQNAYKDAQTQTECPAPGAKPTVICAAGPIGEPATTTKALLSVELRGTLGKFQMFGGSTIAIDPLVTFDAHSSTYGIDAPVYLFSSSAGLTGGVRADWASDTRAWVVGIFISKPFSLFEHQ
jgi:hypothetical protein